MIAGRLIALIACAPRLDIGVLRGALAADDIAYADALDEAFPNLEDLDGPTAYRGGELYEYCVDDDRPACAVDWLDPDERLTLSVRIGGATAEEATTALEAILDDLTAELIARGEDD